MFAVRYLGIDEYDKVVKAAKPVVLPAQKSNQPDSSEKDDDDLNEDNENDN